MVRTCHWQTRSAGGQPIDQALHWAGPTQAEDRDVVTPANDLMYTTAWLNLADGPRVLQVPADHAHPGRYFVLALYDAYIENFANLGPRNSQASGESVWLLCPDDATPVPSGQRVLRSPTTLVWLLARVLVADAADLPAAKRLQADIGVAALPGTGHGRLPLAVAQWQGPVKDPMAAVLDEGELPEPAAARFFSNLCQALADEPGRPQDQGLVAALQPAGLRPGPGFGWDSLDSAQRAGLLQGFNDGVALLGEAARHRQARPWVLSTRNGRYGSAYLMRAIVAYIGLGALAPEEALYASGHFDAQGQLLDGRHHYALRFEPGQTPPAQAFWSVTLYAADRFLYPNPWRRHALGDRSPGLRVDPDGGLTLTVGHAAPADAVSLPNWLPAPDGRFYLVLRLYHPHEGAQHWRIPPQQRLVAPAGAQAAVMPPSTE